MKEAMWKNYLKSMNDIPMVYVYLIVIVITVSEETYEALVSYSPPSYEIENLRACTVRRYWTVSPTGYLSARASIKGLI
jgi:hypothetical protein